MAFGSFIKKLASLEESFKELDSKIENFEKKTVEAVDKIDNATKNIVDKTDQNIEKLDKTSKQVSDKVKATKKPSKSVKN